MVKFLIYIFLFLSTFSLLSQEIQRDKKIEIGAFLNYSYNNHTGSLSDFSYINSCCDEFNSGGGSKFVIGFFSSYPITNQLQAQLRLNYSDISADFIEERNTFVNLSNRVEEGSFEHSFLTSINSLGFSLYADYNLSYEFSLLFGPSIQSVLNAEYNHQEKLVKPENKGVFTDTETRLRNAQNGDIEFLNSLLYSFDIGFSLDLPLNQKHTAFLSTELIYNIGLTSLTSDQDWQVNAFRLGLMFKYELYKWKREQATPLKPAEEVNY